MLFITTVFFNWEKVTTLSRNRKSAHSEVKDGFHFLEIPAVATLVLLNRQNCLHSHNVILDTISCSE